MSAPIDRMIRERRQALARDKAEHDAARQHGAPEEMQEVWGLALSGGGIRSATFCFGLLHALATRGLLLRFDLLSTVSGGGYIGAMLGRLLQRARNVADVHAIVAALARGSDSWFAWWLRANGRYLVPLGVKDSTFALAVYLRNLIGIHLELALVGLLLGCLLAGFDVLGWVLLADLARVSWWAVDWAREWIVWIPTPWALLAPLTFVALVLCWAFWIVAWVSARPRDLLFLIWVVLAVVVIGALLGSWVSGQVWREQFKALTTLLGAFVAIGVLWLCAVPVAMLAWMLAAGKRFTGLRQHFRLAGDSVPWQDAARSRLTIWLATTLRAGGWIVLIGLLDRAAWWLAVERQSWVTSGYVLAIAAAVLRVLLSPVSGIRHAATGSKWTLTFLSLLGRVLTFVLFTWWVAVVHRVSLTGIFVPEGIEFGKAILPLLLIAGIVGIYLLMTGMNIRFLNLSSMHGFYRARLVRSYLGASNPARFDGSGAAMARVARDLHAIDPLPSSPEDHHIKGVGDVDPGDDVSMAKYAPHLHGGPVHLINACLNETTDPRGGLFNQDRRGRAITVGPGAILRVGRREKWVEMSGPGALTLGSWMAISGAAVSPGLGSRTRGGIPSLAMFAGARLGYWWDNEEARHEPPRTRRVRVFTKVSGLLRETFGIFAGADARDWYLTDGGHFENTGVYALLAERAKLIMVADCGADPGYRFGDMENLVRKARIDLQAEIEFLKPRIGGTLPVVDGELLGRFGSLNDLASNASNACFALARISYAPARSEEAGGPAGSDSPGASNEPEFGYLVAVKPNMCAGLPVDLVNFKLEHPEFPQQSTADQFFDEAQWESYFQLGKTLGEMFSPPSLKDLTTRADELFTRDDGSPIEKDSREKGGSDASKPGAAGAVRMPSRLATAAVSSAGFGVAAAAGLAIWQAIDVVKANQAQQVKDERAALKELTELWEKVKDDGTTEVATANALAGTLARVSDSLCPANDAGWFNRSALAVEILAYTLDRCSTLPANEKPPGCTWLARASDPFAESSQASCLMVGKTLNDRLFEDEGCTRYWGYDYRFHSLSRCAHMSDPVLASRRPREEEERRARTVLDALPHLDGARLATACAGKVIAPFVFQNTDAETQVKPILEAWRSKLGLDVGETQDIVVKARQLGRSPPVPVTQTTVRYRVGDAECAQALAQNSGPAASLRLQLLTTAGRSDRETLEVLFAPVAQKVPGPSPQPVVNPPAPASTPAPAPVPSGGPLFVLLPPVGTGSSAVACLSMESLCAGLASTCKTNCRCAHVERRGVVKPSPLGSRKSQCPAPPLETRASAVQSH
jgi:hypothetical protein